MDFASPHLNFAHIVWRNSIEKGDLLVDATAGNGRDSEILAKSLSVCGGGTLHCIDLQQEAIDATKIRIDSYLQDATIQIFLHTQSHEKLPLFEKPPKLIVYNLGYLPGGNKNLTTLKYSTLLSVKNAMQSVAPGGLISITCYPGHREGAEEELALLEFCSTLSDSQWHVSHTKWLNRIKPPSLFFIRKLVG